MFLEYIEERCIAVSEGDHLGLHRLPDHISRQAVFEHEREYSCPSLDHSRFLLFQWHERIHLYRMIGVEELLGRFVELSSEISFFF